MEFLSGAALSAAGVVLLVQEILKLQVVPGSFANRWPVPTNIVLSLVATIAIVRPTFTPDNLPAVAVQVGTIAVIAAIAYNQLISKWLKPVEGSK
jgi:hypothetical protein